MLLIIEMYIPSNWSLNEILYNGSQRLGMVSTANYLFNRQGEKISDTLSIEDNDTLIFSNNSQFRLPKELHEHNSGNIIIGSYVVGKTIGHGGFGSVRLGKNLNSGESFALKFINKNLKTIKSAEFITGEMHTLMGIDHPNIIKLYDVIDNPKHLIFVFEYAENGDLQEYMNKYNINHTNDYNSYNGLDEIICYNYMIQLLNALSYAHNLRYVHRDIKLANILLKSNNEIIKIGDFGLSRVFIPGQDFKSKV